MEQPNMMAAGMPGQLINPMQRPQNPISNQQVHARILEDLRNSLHQIPLGWQSTFSLDTRAAYVMQL